MDFNYINKFIAEGVIRNQFDIEEINKHLKSKIFGRFLKRLNNSYPLTSIELEELLY